MKVIFSLFIVVAMISTRMEAQEIKVYTPDRLMNRCSSKDTVYIVNFWATWCVPCVQELPEFNKLEGKYANMPVKVLLVSMDYKEDYFIKIPEFLSKNHLTPEVVWLSDADPNVFIAKIDNEWLGSTPATMIMQPGKQLKKFIERKITEDEISAEVDKALK